MTTDLSPGKKAQHTARWARTITTWLITYSHRTGARWIILGFGGKRGAEARGIVDLMAIRKDHRPQKAGVRRGDLFEIVLIQTKGGSSRLPTAEDTRRLVRVAKHHRATAVVLANWQRGRQPVLFRLEGSEWLLARPEEVFG